MIRSTRSDHCLPSLLRQTVPCLRIVEELCFKEYKSVEACSAAGIQHAGGNRQSRIRNDASTKVDESRRCVTYSQKAYTMDGPGEENNKLTLGSLA